MGRLAVVGGHSILGNEPDGGLERQVVETRRGAVTVLVGSSHLLLQRQALGLVKKAKAGFHHQFALCQL